MQQEKQPKDWTECPACFRDYSFIRCRITLKNPTRNLCLECAIKEPTLTEPSGKLF